MQRIETSKLQYIKRSKGKRRVRQIVNLMIIGSIFICFTGLLNGTTYYVSLFGNDNWPGTSPDSTWRHLAYATQQVQAGDSVLVFEGVYEDEHAVFANSGSSENPIMLTAYSDTFVMDGIDSTGTAIRIVNKSYIAISGFYIKNYGVGVRGEGILENLSLSSFVIEKTTGEGLHFNSGALRNSIITDFILRNTGGKALSHYDFGAYPCYDVEISHFLIRDIEDEGILFENGRRVHFHHGKICNTASDGLHLYKNSDSCVIEYIHVDTTGWHGIAIHDPYMNRPCSCNVIRNCFIRNADHGSIDLHSGAFNTIVENCSLIGPKYTTAIYFHNRGAGLLAQNNYIKNMHWGLFCGHTNEGHFIKDVVFKNNIVENTERYGGCAWRDTGNRILSNVSFIDNTFIHCSQQSGYHNLVLVRVDTAHVEENSFIESLIPDEPHIRLGEVSNGHVLDLADDFTRIQVYDTDAILEFSDGKAFIEDGTNQPFWFPEHSEYLLNLDEIIEINTFAMTLSPLSDSLELVILQWDTTGTYYKNWQEISENQSVTTSHTVGDFPEYAHVKVDVDGVLYGMYWADSSGWISFDYTAGFAQDTVMFEAYEYTGVSEQSSNIITQIISLQVNPNPFTQMTEIKYQVPDIQMQDVRNNLSTSLGTGTQDISLKIYDVSGRIVKVFNLTSGLLLPASTVSWDGTDDSGCRLSAGVYFARLEARDYSITEKAILLR